MRAPEPARKDGPRINEEIRVREVHLITQDGSNKGTVPIAAALAAGAVLGMVPLVLDTGRAVRANLSLDAGLLDAIDEAAKAHGLTRSAFLASAAREKIEGPSGSREMHTDRSPTHKPVGRHTNKRRGKSASSKMARSKRRVK